MNQDRMNYPSVLFRSELVLLRTIDTCSRERFIQHGKSVSHVRASGRPRSPIGSCLPTGAAASRFEDRGTVEIYRRKSSLAPLVRATERPIEATPDGKKDISARTT